MTKMKSLDGTRQFATKERKGRKKLIDKIRNFYLIKEHGSQYLKRHIPPLQTLSFMLGKNKFDYKFLYNSVSMTKLRYSDDNY